MNIEQIIRDRVSEATAANTQDLTDRCWDLYGFIAGVLPHLPDAYQTGASAALARARHTLDEAGS